VTEKRLDTANSIETPEGVILELHPCGPVARGGAWLVDALIRTVLYLVLAFVLAFLGDVGMGLILIAFFLLEWFYPVYFELSKGATPGKAAFGLLVVHTNGTPIAWQASMLRNLLRVVDFLPLLYGFGLVSMLLNRRFQRLGDLAAGTLVIHRPEVMAQPRIQETDAIAPPAGLTLREQQAIISYAERVPRLSESRQIELATHLYPLTGQSGNASVETLLGYARWLARGRA
jgi:uncharacterized RDD family membrane protein YckC